jgi:acyl carrier protein
MKEKIKDILKQALKLEINDDIHRNDCDAWDSLAHLNIMILLESEFSISIEPNDFTKINSIGEIESLIANYKNR